MKVKEFLRALDEWDFAVDDSFWLNGIEFEVKNKDEELRGVKA